jgi:hypothetical protein
MYTGLFNSDYDLTPKQNYEFQQWRERKKKCEEERRRKQPFILMSMRPPTIFDRMKMEQNYFDKLIQELERKGEVFKIKSKYKSKR